MDRGTQEVKELKPDSYQFKFKQTADIMIYNAAAVDVRFNGRSLGSLGTAGRIRRLSFSAPMENAELANPFGVDRKL